MINNKLVQGLSVVGVLMVSVVFWGCGKSGDDEPVKPTIALVMKSLANEFFKTMQDGAQAHHRQHADQYELKTTGIKNEEDVAQQISLVETLMAQGIDALVIAPADSKALVPVCAQALSAGIVVVNIDNKLDPEVLKSKGVNIPFVGPDNRAGARLVGEYLAKRLKRNDQVAIVEGVPNAFNGVQRKLGFEDAMQAAGMKIVTSQSGYWETAKASQVVSAIVTATPGLKAVLCANDSMALGAVAAIKAAGKAKDILIIGFDNIEAVQMLLQDGQVLATIDQHADKLAVFGIEYALEILTRKTTPADKQTSVDLVTAETLR